MKKQLDWVFSGVVWSVLVFFIVGALVFVYDLKETNDLIGLFPDPETTEVAEEASGTLEPGLLAPSEVDSTPGRPDAESMVVPCIGIIDGDTIDVLVNRQPVRIRVAGIDCPERGQPFGTVAKQFTSRFCFRRDVQLTLGDIDKYGRQVAWVAVDGQNLSVELLRAGLAWHDRYSPAMAVYEEEARQAKIGIWRDDSAISPREWRQQHP